MAEGGALQVGGRGGGSVHVRRRGARGGRPRDKGSTSMGLKRGVGGAHGTRGGLHWAGFVWRTWSASEALAPQVNDYWRIASNPA